MKITYLHTIRKIRFFFLSFVFLQTKISANFFQIKQMNLKIFSGISSGNLLKVLFNDDRGLWKNSDMIIFRSADNISRASITITFKTVSLWDNYGNKFSTI